MSKKYNRGWRYYKIKNLKPFYLWITGGIIDNAFYYQYKK